MQPPQASLHQSETQASAIRLVQKWSLNLTLEQLKLNSKRQQHRALHQEWSNQHKTNNEQRHCQKGIECPRYWTPNCSYHICLQHPSQSKAKIASNVST
jgi:hypothetical protein